MNLHLFQRFDLWVVFCISRAFLALNKTFSSFFFLIHLPSYVSLKTCEVQVERESYGGNLFLFFQHINGLSVADEADEDLLL